MDSAGLLWSLATGVRWELAEIKRFMFQRVGFVIIRSWVRLPSPAPIMFTSYAQRSKYNFTQGYPECGTSFTPNPDLRAEALSGTVAWSCKASLLCPTDKLRRQVSPLGRRVPTYASENVFFRMWGNAYVTRRGDSIRAEKLGKGPGHLIETVMDWGQVQRMVHRVEADALRSNQPSPPGFLPVIWALGPDPDPRRGLTRSAELARAFRDTAM
jgi:hypothetical protein